MAVHLIQADARRLPLPDGSVQTVITSPPYFGLRDYGTPGQIGLEPTPAEFVEAMVRVFREVRRVLRDDGTLWLNLGDSYNAHPGQRKTTDKVGPKQATNTGSNTTPSRHVPGLKAKDLIGVPWLVAFALRADGWYLRDCIIWHKPNPMPSSVTDRTTTAHEYVFLLTKKARYYYDADAIREPITSTGGASIGPQKKQKVPAGWKQGPGSHGTIHDGGRSAPEVQSRTLEDPSQRNHPLGRNKRSVWTIPTQSFHGAHFATFPTRLVEPMIRAATSEKGCCPKCGAGWRRVVERVSEPKEVERIRNVGGRTDGYTRTRASGGLPPVATVTTNWVPGCQCHAGDPVPCTVLDCFSGAGTTVMVADRLGRTGIGTDLSGEYLRLSRDRYEEDLRQRKHGKVKRPRTPKGEPTLFSVA